jgi:predicted MFS family arabinose efflux permease
MTNLRRNVRLFYPYIFLNRLDMWLPIMTLFLLDRGFTLTQYAIVDAMWYVSTVFFEVPTGVITDRCGKKMSLLIAAAVLSLSLFIVFSTRTFALLLVGYLLWGFANSFETGTTQAFIYDSLRQLKKAGQFRRVLGRVQSLSILAGALGCLIAGYLGAIDLGLPVLVTAGIALGLCPVIFFFKEPAVSDEREPDLRGHLVRSVRTIWDRRVIMWLILYGAILETAVWGLYIFYQPYLVSFNVSVERIGLFYLFFKLTAASGAHFSDALYRRFGKISIYLVPLLFVGAVFGMGFVGASWAVGFIFVIFFTAGIYYPIVADRLHQYLPSDKRATIISLGSALSCLVGAVCYPLLARLAETVSLQATFKVLGLGILVTMGLVLIALRKEEL